MEGYSKKAFEENEGLGEGIKALFGKDGESLAEAHTGGQRERLLGLAHEEALAENKAHESGSEGAPIGELFKQYSKILLETESGNSYEIHKNEDFGVYLVKNYKTQKVETVTIADMEGSVLKKGSQFFFGNGANTSPIMNIKAQR
jgi:hypothetical protein